MNRFLKLAIVVSCLLVCGAATIIVPTNPRTAEPAWRAIRVNNGHFAHNYWLKA